ncbi:MAG: amidohydrolase family protein [Pseudomonadota bacterium]
MARIAWDTLIRGALVFDGSGEEARREDVAIRDGRIAARGINLPKNGAKELIEADGQWLMPGLLDIHTHLDLEVDLEPGLAEVVRHGTTTVVVGNCSLGTAFGKQIIGDSNPIVDCFTRVENIPKKVLAKCVDAVTWDNTGDYMDHFDDMPLGPNVASFLPHSMLRIEVMGLEASISREPTDGELEQMAKLLEKALDQGFLGLSTDGLPFHYLANAPHTDKRIPTQFAPRREMKRLLQVVRDKGRVWQTTPIIENRLKAFTYFAFTSGLLYGKALKTSALSVMEFALLPKASRAFLGFAKLMNSKLFKGNMHFQALGTNFRLWSDGIVSPMFEELDSACQLIAKEYDDVEGRRALLNDPAFIEDFRRDWLHGRQGFNLAHLKAKLGMPDSLVIRDFKLLVFDDAPVPEWNGESFQQVLDRLIAFQAGRADQARSELEREVFSQFPAPIMDDANFMLHMLREYDRNFRFWADVGNVGNRATLDFLLDPDALPGFNDSGAHITNMAFFDTNLMSLRLAQQKGLATVAQMVRRLTREPAEFFNLDAGSLELGARADITLIDPEALKHHDCDKGRELIYRELFEHQQMVNRSDGVVTQVLINGTSVWQNDAATDALGRDTLGIALRAA